jgi:hypothetical protein
MKPKMILDVRISTNEAHKQRYTEEEIKTEIKAGQVEIKLSDAGKVPLLIRKRDGAVLGEILI